MNALSSQRAAAVIQIVSGLTNLTVMAFIGFWTLTIVGTICTVCLGGIGGLYGFFAVLLIPIGIFEVVAGLLGLLLPDVGAKVMRICAFVELGSLLAGGVVSAVAGYVALTLLRPSAEEARTRSTQST